MYLKRPETVDFDPSLREHRLAAYQFRQRRSWADCPLRFSHDPGYGSIAEQIDAKLLNWLADRDLNQLTRRQPLKVKLVA